MCLRCVAFVNPYQVEAIQKSLDKKEVEWIWAEQLLPAVLPAFERARQVVDKYQALGPGPLLERSSLGFGRVHMGHLESEDMLTLGAFLGMCIFMCTNSAMQALAHEMLALCSEVDMLEAEKATVWGGNNRLSACWPLSCCCMCLELVGLLGCQGCLRKYGPILLGR